MNATSVTCLLLPCDPTKGPEPVKITGFTHIQELIAELVIPLHVEPADVILFVDADDRRKGLPPNTLASCLRWLWDPDSRLKPTLHGDVLLTGGTDLYSTLTEAPPWLREELLHGGPYQLTMRGPGSEEWQYRSAIYDDYATATWAIITLSQDEDVEDVRIVPAAARDTA